VLVNLGSLDAVDDAMIQSEPAGSEPARDAVPFRPLQRVDGQLPIEDHGLLGDGTTAALVGRDGTVSWLCLPRFDSDPLLAGLLDVDRGGELVVTMEDAVESRQWYERDTAVLVTELRGPSGIVRITDALVVFDCDLAERARADRGELLREIRAIDGYPAVRVRLRVRNDARIERRGDVLEVRTRRNDVDVNLASTKPLAHGPDSLFWLHPGERAFLSLRWRGHPDPALHAAPRRHDDTRRAWRSWAARISYDGPARSLIRRSLVTLKQLHFLENGAIIAAPTTSLPVLIGGARNWDYRYAWIRDAAFSVEALRNVGLPEESGTFIRWVFDAIAHAGRPRTLYDVDGHAPVVEHVDDSLRGYRRSQPVRVGNAAADQVQRDALGHVLECAWEFAEHHGDLDAALWSRLQELVDLAAKSWREADHGIWETRGSMRRFTYSAAQCHVALTRGAALAEQLGLDSAAWRREAGRIASAIIEDAWDERVGALCGTLDGERVLEPAVLALSKHGIVPADHPRMIATRAAIRRDLDVGDGMLLRSVDEKGAFVFCSAWLVENLALAGELDQAHAVFERMCACASPLGLLAEQIDVDSGAFLGNFPQGLSHVGLLRAALALEL
jgi:GH15 family glucan-1,4-alpha-glucosidase